MSPIVASQTVTFARQLNGLESVTKFVAEVSKAILPGNDEFESVWTIANRVCDRYGSPKVRFMKPARERPENTALSA